jgi:hypothetical protein
LLLLLQLPAAVAGAISACAGVACASLWCSITTPPTKRKLHGSAGLSIWVQPMLLLLLLMFMLQHCVLRLLLPLLLLQVEVQSCRSIRAAAASAAWLLYVCLGAGRCLTL